MPSDGATCRNRYLSQPLLSERPFQTESTATFLSISFFQSRPSAMTRYHSLQTSSARQSDLASK